MYSVFQQSTELFVALVPHSGVFSVGLIAFDLKGIAHNMTGFGHILNFTERHSLNTDIADCGCFNWTGVYRNSACVCSQLAERLFLAASADYIDKRSLRALNTCLLYTSRCV